MGVKDISVYPFYIKGGEHVKLFPSDGTQPTPIAASECKQSVKAFLITFD